MKKKEKTYLFVDGTNLYAGQYELFGPEKYLDFEELVQTIGKHLYPLKKIFFYASYTPKPKRVTTKILNYLRNEALFYKSVRNSPNLIFFKGHRSIITGKEKGVDMHLGIDMVKGAILKEYSLAVLMTGDSDLTYAVDVSKQFQPSIHTVFLSNRYSPVLAFRSKSVLFFRLRSDKRMIKRTLLPKRTIIVDL